MRQQPFIKPPDEILLPEDPLPRWSDKSRKRLGFTGTQEGMTQAQQETVAAIILVYKPVVAQHGDCVGADEEFHNLARSQGVTVDIFPPKDAKKRAFCKFARKVHEPENYLVRNNLIVINSDFIIAAPKEYHEVLRSGTWSTIRRTQELRKPLTIVWPDGKTTHYSVGYKSNLGRRKP